MIWFMNWKHETVLSTAIPFLGHPFPDKKMLATMPQCHLPINRADEMMKHSYFLVADAAVVSIVNSSAKVQVKYRPFQ